MWGDFGKFIWSAGIFGGGSVIFAIILFVIAVIEHYRDKNIAARTLAFVGCLAFCFGAYSAWKDENESLKTETELYNTEHAARLHAEDVSKPNLDAQISGVSVSLDRKGQTILWLFLTVVNHGAPSIVHIEKVTVVLENGKIIPTQGIVGPFENVVIRPAKGNPQVFLKASDYFPNKAISNPIPEGGAVIGWVVYMVPGCSQADLTIPGTKIELQGSDVSGVPFTATKTYKQGPLGFYNPAAPSAKPQ